MTKHEFRLYFRGPRPLGDEDVERLYEAGFDDTSFGAVSGTEYAAFHRRAESFSAAVLIAIRQLEDALPRVRVIAVEGDELVTASEIARRTGRTRESVRLLVAGKRGPGGFPPPVPWVSAAQTRLFEWRDVAEWFARALGEDVGESEHSRFAAALNAALAIREHAALLTDPAERVAVAEILREDAELLAGR
jgi:hypothetical protein